ncbi:hypothetical protein KA062_02995 [Patescibacteria group bacterium]|nr:hypothetical protein [Patescibacteria group bacterium]
MKIRAFFDRNKPIFIIGIVMFVIFSVIIVSSILMPKKETGYTEIGDADKEFYKVAYEDLGKNEFEGTEEEGEKKEEPVEQEVNMDEIFGVLQVDYTEEGFVPRVTRIRVGQNVNWTNKTDKIIYLKQIKPYYKEFEESLSIKPNESFKFKMTEIGIWTYEETESGDWGSIEAKPLPSVMPEPKPKTETPATEDLKSTTEPTAITTPQL